MKIITKRAVVMVKKEGRIFQKLLEREPFFPIRASPCAHAQRKEGDMVRDHWHTHFINDIIHNYEDITILVQDPDKRV